MHADDPDPSTRWRAISDWYAELAAMDDWGHVAPMVEIAAWIGQQPFAGAIFPNTSHEWLCVQSRPGYHPGSPAVSCGVHRDHRFECERWDRWQLLDRWVLPLELARAGLAESVGWLLTAGAPAGPS